MGVVGGLCPLLRGAIAPITERALCPRYVRDYYVVPNCACTRVIARNTPGPAALIRVQGTYFGHSMLYGWQ